MHRPDNFLRGLAKSLRSLRGNAGRSRPARRYPARPGVEQFETRNVLSPVLELPAGGGSYLVDFESGDVVVRQSDSTELYRSAISDSAVLTIKGTSSAEKIQVDLRSGLDTVTSFALELDGGGGADSATVFCSSGKDSVNLQPTGVSTVVGPNYSLSLSQFPLTYVYGNGGSAVLGDTPGNDKAVLTPSYAYLQNDQSNIVQQVLGFSVYAANATHGGIDAAWLYDSPGDDLAVMTPATAYFAKNPNNVATTPYESASGFDQVTANASAGGYDTLSATGSTGNDALFFTPRGGYLRGPNFSNWFAGFEVHNVQGAGGQDIATLQGSPDADIYTGSGANGRLTTLTAKFELNISKFNKVSLSGAGGLNVITLAKLNYAIAYPGFIPISSFLRGPMDRAHSLAMLKQIATAVDPALARVKDPTTLAIMLRNDVHNGIRLGVTTPLWQRNDAYDRYIQAVLTQQEGSICGAMQILYVDLLQAFGLKGRYVGLFANDINHNTHATVEVLLGGQWVVMDPTFNVSFIGNDGKRLSYAAIQAGASFTVSRDGMVSRPMWLLENYGITIQELCYRITYPATVTN